MVKPLIWIIRMHGRNLISYLTHTKHTLLSLLPPPLFTAVSHHPHHHHLQFTSIHSKLITRC
ncbi:hypothetical protein HanIR_Chr04g0175271 [Helianthus annuus]|nr:hypothetical protein HanIR_Chr04g0175271 [Helianthus annuus]